MTCCSLPDTSPQLCRVRAQRSREKWSDSSRFRSVWRLRDSIADTASSIVRMTIVRGCLQASHSGQPKVIPECIERQVTSACSVSLSHGIGEGAGPTHPTIDSVAGSAGIPRKRLSGLTCTPQCAPRGRTCLAAFIGDSHALMSDNRCGCDSQRAVASIGQGQGQAWGTPRFVSIDRRAHGGTGPRSTVTTWHGGMGAQPHFATEREDYYRGTRQRLTRAGVLRATERGGWGRP